MSKPTHPGKMFHAPERVVERGRGCWNCKHFDNGVTAQRHYQSRISQERAGLATRLLPSPGRLSDDDGSIREAAAEAGRLIRQGYSMENAMDIALARQTSKSPLIKSIVTEARAQDARFVKFTAMVAQGAVGICLIGKPPGDFVDCRYLCDDGWNGVTGSSVATEGHPLDKSSNEIRDEIDAKAEKV